MRTATFTMGLPAAGKSTWVRRNIENEFVVDPDAVKESHPLYDPKNPAALHEWSKRVAASQFVECLSGTDCFVVDGTGTRADVMRDKMTRARAAGFHVRLVFVTCSLETSLARNANRERVVPEHIIREKFETIERAHDVVRKFADTVEIVNTEN